MEQPNLLAVLVAGIAPMIIGALWYGPLFGRLWLRLIGKTEEEIRESANPLKMYGITLLGNLITAYVLAHILQAFDAAYGAQGLVSGLEAGFWCFLGFVLTVGWQAVAFEDKKLSLYGLNMLYNLVTLLVMGAILGIWP